MWSNPMICFKRIGLVGQGSECEELFLFSAVIEQLSQCFDLNSQNHY